MICAADECQSVAIARGFCNPHWHRWHRYGDPLGRPKLRTVADKLHELTVRSADPDGCWIWIGSTYKNGYGKVWSRVDRRHVLAHRAAWEEAFGEIPPGRMILHQCDVRACVNPAHLHLGTQAENMADMATKKRSMKGRSWTTVDGRRSWA